MSDLLFSSSQTRKTVTAKLILNGSQVGSDIGLTEGSVAGEYTANMPANTPAGNYIVAFYYDGAKVGSTQILWDGHKEITLRDVLQPTIETL